MSLFKCVRKNKNQPAVLYSIDLKIKEAREKHERHFYYPLDDKEVDMVRAYCMSQYRALVEVDHKTNDTIVYKIYGYSID